MNSMLPLPATLRRRRRRRGDAGNLRAECAYPISLPARFAEAGYYAVAPALFDRAERGVELGYDADWQASAESR